MIEGVKNRVCVDNAGVLPQEISRTPEASSHSLEEAPQLYKLQDGQQTMDPAKAVLTGILGSPSVCTYVKYQTITCFHDHPLSTNISLPLHPHSHTTTIPPPPKGLYHLCNTTFVICGS